MEPHINGPRATTPPATRPETSVNHYRQNFDTKGSIQPNPLDRLLADIAIRIQLSRTDYDKAIRRYESISDWIERDASLLRGSVELFYPQGSMAIGATIAARGTDEFDIDVVVQLLLAAKCLTRDAAEHAACGDQRRRGIPVLPDDKAANSLRDG